MDYSVLSHQVPHQQKLTAFVLAAVLIMAFVVDRSSFVYTAVLRLGR